MNPSHYQRNFLFTCLALVAAVALLNWFVDPYWHFGSRLIPGFNEFKAKAHSDRVVLPRQLKRIAPGGLILGSSRAESGLTIDHPGWQARPRFNFALPFPGMYEIMRYYQHAQASGPLEQVVLSLDFFAFNSNVHNDDFEEYRLAVTAEGEVTQAFDRDVFPALFSLGALQQSIQTVLRQGSLKPHIRSWSEASVPSTTHRYRFESWERRFLDFGWNTSCQPYAFGQGSESTFESYRSILASAYANGVDLKLFVSPVHARLMIALEEGGLQATYDDWKQQLVNINESEAKHAGKLPYSLWDFSGFDHYHSEGIPQPGERGQMQWFRDSSHYTRKLGWYIFDRIFKLNQSDRMSPNDFGVLLYSNNIADHLMKQQEANQRYRSKHPEVIEAIRIVAKETFNSRAYRCMEE